MEQALLLEDGEFKDEIIAAVHDDRLYDARELLGQ